MSKFEDLPKELQQTIAELNVRANNTVYPKDTLKLRIPLLSNPFDVKDGSELIEPRYVRFNLVKRVGEQGRYIFDAIE